MKRRGRTKVRRDLSYGTLVVGVLLFAYSIATAAPSLVAEGTKAMLANASVGVSAAVAPNPDNTLYAQLQAKAAELSAREAKLQQQENAPPATLSEQLGVYAFFISCALFVLVAFNFYFDWRRSRRFAL